MRRSKSDPAKYARNYRAISQHRMTDFDGSDEEKEIKRLRSILRNSEAHLKDTAVEQPSVRSSSSENKQKGGQEDDCQGNSVDTSNKHSNSILSSELLAQSDGVYGTENPLVVLPSKTKTKQTKQKQTVTLTPQEIREAKALHKKTARKLQQLEVRASKKQKRADLYKKLEQHQISKAVMRLLSSSGKVSRKDSQTKRETLQKLLAKERAGIKLSQEERELLHPERIVEETTDHPVLPLFSKEPAVKQDLRRKHTENKLMNSRSRGTDMMSTDDRPMEDPEDFETQHVDNQNPESPSSIITTTSSKEKEKDEISKDSKKFEVDTRAGTDFAAQMMASLSRLKERTTKFTNFNSSMFADENTAENHHGKISEKKYIPSATTLLKTASSLGIQSKKIDVTRRVVTINRPELIEKARYDLPVSGMEFEIMDAIRNNDVTIICGETGSGKSTQVPQFIYESGLCLSETHPEMKFSVGITQPRRVAAVSTAKRVCYEMGRGDGQSIKSVGGKGNLVSYHTRYETAGRGTETCVEFMTDGILLQEIQSDFLLRRYSVIILDESHERNLNTDVLIGLLSAALPLRKQAAQEDPSLVPLRLVLMSATLRVEDFTTNEKLFPSKPPALVTVPGRSHPVTIHHSKVTELDDYESAAFRKVCKIHRKLPQGGILVFLTGKREIVRMVNSLRKTLKPPAKQSRCSGMDDVKLPESELDKDGVPRDLDDDELDADDYILDEEEDFEDNDNVDDIKLATPSEEDSEGNIPKHAYVLPLYSLLSAEEQAKVFAPIPDDHRLIVIATNIAETSITIPGIAYVVDTGRQKSRNYSSGTGVASYDVMWISKAAAEQRAGRAGRTGPGHCYRLYSSSLYARHMDSFSLPEVLSRPLEDVVLAMKALRISNVSNFPFPTPPDRSQIKAAVNLLANIGCVDMSGVEVNGGDGTVTRLGQTVAKLPVGVRYAKMLLVAAQAGVLDYAIVIVSILSESNPLQHGHCPNEENGNESDGGNDSLDSSQYEKRDEAENEAKKIRLKWGHKNGDIMAAMLAVGAYTYACKGAGGVSEHFAGRKFCDQNGLNHVIMTRIQKMRTHLASLARNRMGAAEGVAAKTGGYSSKMKPPNNLQEVLMMQAVASGFLDNVALLAPPGSISGYHPFGVRSAYLACSLSSKEPLFVDRNSVLFSRDYRQLPKWVCYDTILMKTLKNGISVRVMKNITPIDPSWLGELANGTKLLSLGAPLPSPPPVYDPDEDVILCAVSTKFGSHGWEIPPVKQVMYDVLNSSEAKQNADFLLDDSFRWFARFLLEGKVISELKQLEEFLNDKPIMITNRKPIAKVSILVSALSIAGIDSAAALRKHWAEIDDKFLFKNLNNWIKHEKRQEVKTLWIKVVKENIIKWNNRKAKAN